MDSNTPFRRRRWCGARLVTIGIALIVGAAGSSAAETPQGERRQALLNMLRHDCGSCHGMTLKGGLGPALLPEALNGKPNQWLADTILLGRPGTAMPPWKPFLSADEAGWLVQQLKNGVGNEP